MSEKQISAESSDDEQTNEISHCKSYMYIYQANDPPANNPRH